MAYNTILQRANSRGESSDRILYLIDNTGSLGRLKDFYSSLKRSLRYYSRYLPQIPILYATVGLTTNVLGVGTASEIMTLLPANESAWKSQLEGGSHLGEGLATVVQQTLSAMGSERKGLISLVMMTDGLETKETVPHGDIASALTQARNQGMSLELSGFVLPQDEQNLRTWASSVGFQQGEVFVESAETLAGLSALASRTVDESTERTISRYTSTNSGGGGTRGFDGSSLTGGYSNGYNGFQSRYTR